MADPAPLTDETACCDYRDHSPGPCACPEHEEDALHPFGGKPHHQWREAAWRHQRTMANQAPLTDDDLRQILTNDPLGQYPTVQQLVAEVERLRGEEPVGFVKGNGAGEIIFRHGHPGNYPVPPWRPVYVRPLA